MENCDLVDVLLAEDDEFDAELTIAALHRVAPQRTVLRVLDGAEALQFIFRQGPFANRSETLPKLILLDLDMPRAGGLEVLRQLRDYAPTKELPVAILTASLKQSDFFQTQEIGVWEYLVKPVTTQALMDLVSQIGL